MRRLIVIAVLVSVACVGCAEQSAVRAPTPVAAASCDPEPDLAAAPLPGEIGVYRAGRLRLVAGDRLLRHLDRGSL